MSNKESVSIAFQLNGKLSVYGEWEGNGNCTVTFVLDSALSIAGPVSLTSAIEKTFGGKCIFTRPDVREHSTVYHHIFTRVVAGNAILDRYGLL